ncbi:DUF1266 domain-containing protein [Phytohalomonas tamaricis]|uniref:DUF1266 domain-containing protein n=1 Tax=Phytohalomonas tamaricis TaxID=2081032 RepID=UPI000D0B5FFE|nr:YbeU/YbeR family protein [Phytohalomonas tamaricis]
MDDALRAWWAHELTFLGWEGHDPIRALTSVRAKARLKRFDIGDRGELAWRLIEMANDPRCRRETLELLALGGCVGWLSETRIVSWLNYLRYKQSASETLWPDAPVWRARAAFAPMIENSCDVQFDWPDVQNWLIDVWDIRERDELIRILLWLASQGHRYGWDIDAERLKRSDERTRLAWLSNQTDGKAYGHILLDYIKQEQPLDWAAWDWLRLVDLAFAGLVQGWLNDDEAYAFAAHGVELLQQRYPEWNDVAIAYQRGRSLFEGRDHLASFDDDWGLLLKAETSPWAMPLNKLLDEATREASHQLIKQWRASSYHWLLAIASVREPDLLYRQGIAIVPDQARQEDVRTYLSENLEWELEEGIAGLARFWLPGQAHHLNQLAADASRQVLPTLKTPFGSMDDGVAIAVRDGLKRCASHAATIYMAEKYAFYLLMISDSRAYPEQDLTPLFDKLASVLSRFYGSSHRMLEAWVTWEMALPDSENDSLVADILWHLDDPGSLFHWLDWHVAGWEEPGPRPSLSTFTALALVGPLNAPVWAEPMPQAGKQDEEIREWLDSHYALHTPHSLKSFLDFFIEAGDRQEYQINYAPYTLNKRRLEEEIAILESGNRSEDEQVHLERLRRVRDNDTHCNDTDMAAWDIAQLVDLAVAGRQLDWLTPEEFHAYLEHALALTRRHYGGWHEYARGLYTGYAFFMMDMPDRARILHEFRQALKSWLSGAPPLSGAWSTLDFPGALASRWPPVHIDMLPGDARTLH